MAHLADLSSPWAYIVIGILAALEASAFVGLFVPGELALLTGGYLASIGRVSLPLMMVVAAAAAIVGDSLGYEIGRHFGGRLQASRAGMRIGPERWQRAERYLERRGGRAVFIGRFVGVLRALVPALAGGTRMPYRRFLFWNALGAVIWAPGMVFLGDVGGRSYRRIADIAGKAGLVLVAFATIVAVVVTTARWIARHPEQIRAAVERRLSHPAVQRLGQRYARPLAFLANRLHPGRALGLALTVQVGMLAAAGWAFGAILQDVIAGESNRFDAPVVRWFIAHREPWLTSTMGLVTQLGKAGVLLPVVVAVGVVLHHRQKTWAPLGLLAAAEAGAVALYDLIKPLVGRPRPTLGPLVATATGYSFPSGHATQAVAVYGALVLVSTRRTTSVARVAQAWATATVAALLVGASRVYLGVHWPSDVLAGWALGAFWLAALLATNRAVNVRRRPESSGR